MITVHSIQELRDALRRMKLEHRRPDGDPTIGFVPTMGYLHDGHASLLSKARSQCDIVVLSIFVNPIQFGPNEDYEKYPRDEERDLAVAKKHGADIVFMPTPDMMYPTPTKTKVHVDDITSPLCGATRPVHFDGVTTVVTKLFHLVQPDQAFFGMKDAQQVAVIQRMVEDLNFPVEIVPCPIVREADGLAMSSRNVYLSEGERAQALVLSRSLRQVDVWLEENPQLTAPMLQQKMKDMISQQPLADIDYVEVLSFPDLEPLAPEMSLNQRNTNILIALAVKFGRTRLIDNRMLTHGE
ncbi:pantoate--beta-alanine ligase [Paenibacillus sp. NAIST15-1]|uniref:pantoate--beta-alanine ligase n=1 Tax=Paenibacillus sp. NAIST15-1 TaxID=1605994 RepID=UPI00086B5EF1|nr:pantoate--beta-alanine ligase [Paenibacillus sp. NAIST15-1]GAV11175.1 pantothenate synthetase PanC [Paenibacillus sp. NAIST15-1]